MFNQENKQETSSGAQREIITIIHIMNTRFLFLNDDIPFSHGFM